MPIAWNVVTGVTAVFGAVTGMISLVLSVMNYNRDRPRAMVRLGFNKISIGVYITNVGQRPVNIKQIFVEDKRGHSAEIRKELPLRINEGDGERSSVVVFMDDDFPSDLQIDQPLRATVVEAGGRRYRSRWEQPDKKD